MPEQIRDQYDDGIDGDSRPQVRSDIHARPPH